MLKMSNLRDLIGLASSGNVVAFRQEFANQMNDRMAQMIQFKNTAPPSDNKSINEEEESSDDGEESDDSPKKDNSDIFVFKSAMEIQKAKDIVAEYNATHENNKIELRTFRSSEGTKIYTIGDKVSRIYVRSLIRSVGGKYEK